MLSAMIFAAGVGSRLRPLTDTCPKALIEVGGWPMLERAAAAAEQAGAVVTAVNIHHHAGMMRRWITSHRPRMLISDESSGLLDTGGGLAAALPLLPAAGELLVVNADILTDLPLAMMADAHRRSGADVTLLVADRPTSRYLLFDRDGLMRGWTNVSTGAVRPCGLSPVELTRLAFGGIHVLSERARSALAAYAEGRGAFSITDFYIGSCSRLDIAAYVMPEPYRWFDIGRPETLRMARESNL